MCRLNEGRAGLTRAQEGETHARALHAALEAQMAEEDARRGEKARALFARMHT
jgi:hypothetical protein